MINSLINILFFFCFYSIIFNLILFITRNKLISLLYELIYNFQKFLSYFTNILIHIKLRISLENIIRDILFQEKIHNKEHLFIPAFTYLNEIMLKIKEKNDHKSNILLLKFLCEHMNICDKIKCNCKLLKIFFKNKKIENNNNGNISSNLLITLNFLYEISFLEYDYFNKYEMIILLSEHFCHIRDNPIMAFSLINSLIINNTTLSKFQMVDLYELCQKYIYYIKAMERFDKDYEILENKNDSNAKILRKEYYKKFFNNITSSAIIKKLIKKYIENFSEILECQNIFKESLTFQFDENHEYIDKVKIDFFEKKSLFENKNKERRNKKMKKKKYLSNLYYIIDVLKYEKLYHDNIINTIKEINIFNELPIFMIYKYYLFFDIFEGGFVPLEISSKLYYATSNNLNALNNKITKQIYSLLKSKYNYRNNKMNSKFFVMYKYKKDLRIKYFNEEFALRLGFQQKDLIRIYLI